MYFVNDGNFHLADEQPLDVPPEEEEHSEDEEEEEQRPQPDPSYDSDDDPEPFIGPLNEPPEMVWTGPWGWMRREEVQYARKVKEEDVYYELQRDPLNVTSGTGATALKLVAKAVTATLNRIAEGMDQDTARETARQETMEDAVRAVYSENNDGDHLFLPDVPLCTKRGQSPDNAPDDKAEEHDPRVIDEDVD